MPDANGVSPMLILEQRATTPLPSPRRPAPQPFTQPTPASPGRCLSASDHDGMSIVVASNRRHVRTPLPERRIANPSAGVRDGEGEVSLCLPRRSVLLIKEDEEEQQQCVVDAKDGGTGGEPSVISEHTTTAAVEAAVLESERSSDGHHPPDSILVPVGVALTKKVEDEGQPMTTFCNSMAQQLEQLEDMHRRQKLFDEQSSVLMARRVSPDQQQQGEDFAHSYLVASSPSCHRPAVGGLPFLPSPQEDNVALCSCPGSRSVSLSLGGDTPMHPQRSNRLLSPFDELRDDDDDADCADCHPNDNEGHVACFEEAVGVPPDAAVAEEPQQQPHPHVCPPTSEAQRYVAAFRECVDRSRVSILARLSDVSTRGQSTATPTRDYSVSANSSINLSWMMLPEGGAVDQPHGHNSAAAATVEASPSQNPEPVSRCTVVMKRKRGEDNDDDDDDGADNTADVDAANVEGVSEPHSRSLAEDTRRLEGQLHPRAPNHRSPATPPPTPSSSATAQRLTTGAPTSWRPSTAMDSSKVRLSRDAVSKFVSILTQEGEGGRAWQRLRSAIQQHASTETGGAPSSSVANSSAAASAPDKDRKIELRVLSQVLLSFVRVSNGSSTFVKQRMSAGDVFRGLVTLYVERMQRCPKSQPGSRSSSASRGAVHEDEEVRDGGADRSGMRDVLCAAAGGANLLAAPSPFVVFVERRLPANHPDIAPVAAGDGQASRSTRNPSACAMSSSMRSFTQRLASTAPSMARSSAAVQRLAPGASTWCTVPVHLAEYDMHSKSLCDVGKFWEALRKLRRAELMQTASSSRPVTPEAASS